MKYKYTLAFVIGMCLIPAIHMVAAPERASYHEWGGEVLMPVLTIGITYIGDVIKRYVDEAAKLFGKEDK